MHLVLITKLGPWKTNWRQIDDKMYEKLIVKYWYLYAQTIDDKILVPVVRKINGKILVPVCTKNW
jgi:hypothetical protein